MKTLVRNMTRSDLGRVGEILFEAFNAGASKYGYAPKMNSAEEGTSWAWAMLRHGSGEFLVAEVEGRVAGICCLNPRGVHGGIGPVAVDPSFQGHGIGRQLMDVLLTKAKGLQSVRLFQEAFNVASFSLYYSLQFVPVADLLDLTLDKNAWKGGELSGQVNELKENDLAEVHAYDHPRSQFDRKGDLAYYMKWGKVFVCRDSSGVRGYLACLPGSQSVQMGPLVAEGEEEAKRLFQHALEIFGERSYQTRVLARDQGLVKAIQESGFNLYCVNVLMVRGSWRPGRYVEAFGRFPEGA